MATQGDEAVLHSIFNPLLPIGEFIPDAHPRDLDEPEEVEGVRRSKELEVEGVRLAEAGLLNLAATKFTLAIESAPSRPQPYNNRAQVLRLLGDVEGALEDVNNALNLAKEGVHDFTASQALCQRACILRLQGQEDQAVQDFERAARHGNSFAKGQLVQLNPYAAMCNKMLHEVMEKLQRSAVN